MFVPRLAKQASEESVRRSTRRPSLPADASVLLREPAAAVPAIVPTVDEAESRIRRMEGGGRAQAERPPVASRIRPMHGDDGVVIRRRIEPGTWDDTIVPAIGKTAGVKLTHDVTHAAVAVRKQDDGTIQYATQPLPNQATVWTAITPQTVTGFLASHSW